MKECVENLHCRCTAGGPQQETARHLTPACYAIADSEWLNVVLVHGDDFVSTGDSDDLHLGGRHAQGKVGIHDRHHRTRWRKHEANQGAEQVHFRQRKWVHVRA